MQSVLTAIHSIRNHSMAMVSGTATTAGVNASRQSSVFSYVQSLFTRPVEPISVERVSTTTAVDSSNGNSTDDSAVTNSPNSVDIITRESTLYTDGITSPAVCSACQTTSPEVIFFNLCVQFSFYFSLVCDTKHAHF